MTVERAGRARPAAVTYATLGAAPSRSRVPFQGRPHVVLPVRCIKGERNDETDPFDLLAAGRSHAGTGADADRRGPAREEPGIAWRRREAEGHHDPQGRRYGHGAGADAARGAAVGGAGAANPADADAGAREAPEPDAAGDEDAGQAGRDSLRRTAGVGHQPDDRAIGAVAAGRAGGPDPGPGAVRWTARLREAAR